MLTDLEQQRASPRAEREEAMRLLRTQGYALYWHPRTGVVTCTSIESFEAAQRGKRA